MGLLCSAAVAWRIEDTTIRQTMRFIFGILLFGAVMLMSCSAQIEAQQGDEVPNEKAIEDVESNGDNEVVDQKNMLEEMLVYINPAFKEEPVAEETVPAETEEFADETLGLVGRFFKSLSSLRPAF